MLDVLVTQHAKFNLFFPFSLFLFSFFVIHFFFFFDARDSEGEGKMTKAIEKTLAENRKRV